jgi:hypothetical protein
MTYDTSTAPFCISALRAHADYVERREKELHVLALTIFRAEQNRIGYHGTVPGTKMTLGDATDRHEEITEDLDGCLDTTIALINGGTSLLAGANKHEAGAFHKMLGRQGISGPDRLRLLADLIEFRLA